MTIHWIGTPGRIPAGGGVRARSAIPGPASTRRAASFRFAAAILMGVIAGGRAELRGAEPRQAEPAEHGVAGKSSPAATLAVRQEPGILIVQSSGEGGHQVGIPSWKAVLRRDDAGNISALHVPAHHPAPGRGCPSPSSAAPPPSKARRVSSCNSS